MHPYTQASSIVTLEASRSQRVVEFYVGTDEDELALVASEETVKAVRR